jgi:hypothetical protein
MALTSSMQPLMQGRYHEETGNRPHLLTRMLDSYSNVSDLNMTVGRPLQVESAGELLPVDMKPPIKS